MKKIALLCFLLASLVASAQPIRSARVLTEADEDDERTCQVSNGAFKAAAEAALRYNRIAISSDSSDLTLHVYAIVAPLQGVPTCAASVRIEFFRFGEIFFNGGRSKMRGQHVLCRSSVLLVKAKNSLQTVINDQIKDYVDQCISVIDKAIN